MSTKEQIILDIQNMEDPDILTQLFDYMQFIKKSVQSKHGQNPIREFAGCLSSEDAENMRKIIKEEFNNIEGEW